MSADVMPRERIQDLGFPWRRFRPSRLDGRALVSEFQRDRQPGQTLLWGAARKRPLAQDLGVLVAAPGAGFDIRAECLHVAMRTSCPALFIMDAAAPNSSNGTGDVSKSSNVARVIVLPQKLNICILRTVCHSSSCGTSARLTTRTNRICAAAKLRQIRSGVCARRRREPLTRYGDFTRFVAQES